MASRVNYSAKETEREMQKLRVEADMVTGEAIAVKQLVKQAKATGMHGEQCVMVVDPRLIHIPDWQRRLIIKDAMDIGTNYKKQKWELPKILYSGGKLWCVDGQHRVFGMAHTGKELINVELIDDITMEEAIEIFIGQSVNRRKMSPSDVFAAALVARKPEYVTMKSVCEKYHVQISKNEDESIGNPVGTFTAIRDGVNMARINPEMFESIIGLITSLKWGGSMNGNPYSAIVFRVFKKLYAYYSGNTAKMENILLDKCYGAEYFDEHLADKKHSQLFDYLSKIIAREFNVSSIDEKVKNDRKVAIFAD